MDHTETESGKTKIWGFGKKQKKIHAAFDAVVMIAKGAAENSCQLLLTLLGWRFGCRLPLAHNSEAE
jgi:hypothetical protein